MVRFSRRRADRTVRTASTVPLPLGVPPATRPFAGNASMHWGNSGIRSILCASIVRNHLLVAHFMNTVESPTVRFTTINKLEACVLDVGRQSLGVV